MERRSGIWIASTPARPWVQQGRPIAATRKADVNLRLDGNAYQLWEGFGGGVSERGWEALAGLKGGDRTRALHALFNSEEGCNFHYGRMPVGASNLALDTYSLNDTPGDFLMKHFSVARDRERLIPFMRVPLDRIRKFKVVACPWSPPDWMKEQGGGIAWNPVMLEAYALYLARYVEACQREGIPISHLLVQNEPSAEARKPGCLWTGGQLRDFIRNTLGPTFVKRRLSTRLWLGPLDSARYEEYALTVLSDPMAMQFLAGVACQHGARDCLARIRRAFPDILMMQSDCGEGGGGNTWEQAHDTFAVVQQAIASGACICLYDNLVFSKDGRDSEGRGRNSLISVNPEARTVALMPDYYVFRHFSCLTDRYAVRLGLEGDWSDRAVAFYNENDESRILVVHNPDEAIQRVVLEDHERRLVMVLQPQSFNTVVL